MLDVLSHLNIASGGNKGKGLTSMRELVDMLYLDGSGVNAQDKMKLYYRFHVSKTDCKFGGGKDTQFNLWCFHPGFSLASLVKCNIRTLVLTSGTLKPMDSFQAELSAEFSITLQNDHVIDAKKQINFQVISRGPDDQELLANFANRSNPKYLTSLGQSLVEIAKSVPDGLLIFFASYAWMDSCLSHWKQVGVWERLNDKKECFVEPKNRSGLSKTVSDFRAKVRHPSRIGACFLAVCRGKVSEGIDFADADARAVVIIGIPYPSVYDPKVAMKKKFLDVQKTANKNCKTLSGNEWYNLEAFRAINQAVGRVIRHKKDFGAVLMLDKRFAFPGSTSKLSSWLPPVAKFDKFKTCIESLTTFFSQHHYVPKPEVPKTKGSMPPPRAKRPLSITSMVNGASIYSPSSSFQKTAGPLPKRQKIVIKPRAPLVIKQDAAGDVPAVAAVATSTVSDVNVGKKTSQEASNKKDIQHFVLKLKERLEKSAIKEIIMCVKAYKETGNVRPLAEKLQSLSSKLRNEDIDEFRTYVRSADDKKIFDEVCVKRQL